MLKQDEALRATRSGSSGLPADTDCSHPGPQYNPIPYASAGGAANQLFPPSTPAGAWGMETVLTFGLVFMVLSATDSERAVDAPHLPVRTCICGAKRWHMSA